MNIKDYQISADELLLSDNGMRFLFHKDGTYRGIARSGDISDMHALWRITANNELEFKQITPTFQWTKWDIDGYDPTSDIVKRWYCNLIAEQTLLT